MYPYKVSTAGHVAKACFVKESRNRPSSKVKSCKKKMKEGAMSIFLISFLISGKKKIDCFLRHLP